MSIEYLPKINLQVQYVMPIEISFEFRSNLKIQEPEKPTTSSGKKFANF